MACIIQDNSNGGIGVTAITGVDENGHTLQDFVFEAGVRRQYEYAATDIEKGLNIGVVHTSGAWAHTSSCDPYIH